MKLKRVPVWFDDVVSFIQGIIFWMFLQGMLCTLACIFCVQDVVQYVRDSFRPKP